MTSSLSAFSDIKRESETKNWIPYEQKYEIK